VRALLAAEALKLLTTRAWIGVTIALAGIVGIGAAATVGAARSADLGSPDLSRDLVSASLFSGFLAFLLAITIVTSEWRHGTVARTFLISPRRERVLAAKVCSGLAVGLALAAIGLAVSFAVGWPWLVARGSSPALDRDLLELVVRIVAASALWGALGVGVGALIQSQTPALVIGLVWILVVENLLAAVLGLVDRERIADVLPGRALASFEGSADVLAWWAGGLVALAWIAALCLAGGARMARRDVG
jgi:hypothetical protein